jgi:hypothetical protein
VTVRRRYEYHGGGSEPGAGGSAVWPAGVLRAPGGVAPDRGVFEPAISRAVTSCIVASATEARPSVSITTGPSPPSGKYVARTPVPDSGCFSQWEDLLSSGLPA